MYQIQKLPYLFQDFEPFIDIHTMGLHYHKHYQNYLDKLNELLIKSNYDYRYPINELPYHINEFTLDIREDLLFNLGGVLNHNLYWKSMNPNVKQNPEGKLKEYIEAKYENLENFWEQIKEKALTLKGSGYTFLVLNRDKTLDIINLSNQNMPQSNGQLPLFTIDMWEHAYYLNSENEKRKYLDNFKKVADFTNANTIFNNIAK